MSDGRHDLTPAGPNSRSIHVATVPRVALSVEEACASIGCSRDFWDDHLAGQIPLVYVGRKRLVPVRELERWLQRNATRIRR